MLRILRAIKYVPVVPNFLVNTRGRRYFLDFAFPTHRIGIECHSVKWHLGDRWKRDLIRNRDLTRAGIDMHYFSWHEVHFAPADIRRQVETLLRENAEDRTFAG